MIIDKEQWEHAVDRHIWRNKRHRALMYAHFIFSIPLFIWILRMSGDYELTLVGQIIVNGSFMFAMLLVVTSFQLYRERQYLINCYEMIQLMEEPKDQWGKTMSQRSGQKSDVTGA
jgi:hypothetical protein